MRTVIRAVLIATLLVGCGGGGSPTLPEEPAGVVAAENLLAAGVGDIFNTARGFFDLQLVLTDPEAAAAEGILFQPDPQGPPNQFLFEFPYDSDGDGTDDATADGTIRIPLLPGADGSVDFTTADPDGTGEGMLGFRFVPEGAEIWGDGTTTDTASGITVDFLIPEATPITVRTDQAGDGNLCDLDAEGPIHLTATSLAGVYELLLTFFPGALDVLLSDRLFTGAGAPQSEALPDDTLTLPSCGRTLEDWARTWQLDWTCLPLEGGTSFVTFTRTGPDTMEVDDDGIIFEATADPGNPRVLRGFFIDADSGGTYREDFVFTLAPDGQSWSQANTYEYISGPAEGSTGTCGGTATPFP